MAELRTEIDIDAPAEGVWQVLLDFDAYPQWNPFITSIEGEAREDGRLKARIKPVGRTGVTIKPTVLRVAPQEEFRWRGRLLLPGIFTGEHSFRLEPNDRGGVRFLHEERFTGLLTPLMLLWIGKGTERGFEAMNAALKARAETPSGGQSES